MAAIIDQVRCLRRNLSDSESQTAKSEERILTAVETLAESTRTVSLHKIKSPNESFVGKRLMDFSHRKVEGTNAYLRYQSRF